MKKFSLKIGSKNYKITITEKPRAHLEVKVNEAVFEFPPRHFRDAVKKAMKRYPLDKSKPTKSVIKAPMPGTIGTIFVKENSRISEKEVLCILFSMKMENEVQANQAGKITAVLVKEKQKVNKDQPLFTLES